MADWRTKQFTISRRDFRLLHGGNMVLSVAMYAVLWWMDMPPWVLSLSAFIGGGAWVNSILAFLVRRDLEADGFI